MMLKNVGMLKNDMVYTNEWNKNKDLQSKNFWTWKQLLDSMLKKFLDFEMLCFSLRLLALSSIKRPKQNTKQKV